MKKERGLRVAVLGEGAHAMRWASALRARADICSAPERRLDAVDALIIGPGTSDPFARAKEALSARVSVLYAAPFLLSPWQATALHEMSCRQGLLLRFAEPFQYRPGFAFLHRLLEGEEPFWRPLYLRALYLAPPDTSARIDELATEELAACDALLAGAPQQVTAVASRRDAVSEPCAVFVTVQYSEGALVQCTVSLAETITTHQLIAVTAGRTVVLDEGDPAVPLRIVSGDGQALAMQRPVVERSCRQRAQGSRAADLGPMWNEIERFLSAVSAGDRAPDNGERWARVAALWWAARQSMSFGGPVDVPSPALRPRDTTPPPLRVIEGGGRLASDGGQQPALTVVAR